MAESGLCLALNFWNNALSQHFAQLHTPLIERVDIPDNALSEDRVLVERDELAKRFRHEPFGKHRVRWPVALENAVRHEPVRRALRLDFFRCLTEGQRFGLSKDVCQEHIVMAPKRGQRFGKRYEVAWNKSRSLMNQLVEGV